MKNNPMQGIKCGLAFVFGALYASCWWAILSFWNPDTTWLILPIIGIVFGSVMMVFGIICFFADRWQAGLRANQGIFKELGNGYSANKVLRLD